MKSVSKDIHHIYQAYGLEGDSYQEIGLAEKQEKLTKKWKLTNNITNINHIERGPVQAQEQAAIIRGG
ncbi:hypothetical protein [Motilimonas pumila]|uniref:Uncharacterized protein n=1 Tax=Motilimonas pumila TaxID=2303987 RepID=A0A418YFT9_9GAMM|nr:hypothetical protein [Motilimonas pumila]RJG48400.1 hypothetical protein D1Z90_07865 [Motilimonas pumila]